MTSRVGHMTEMHDYVRGVAQEIKDELGGLLVSAEYSMGRNGWTLALCNELGQELEHTSPVTLSQTLVESLLDQGIEQKKAATMVMSAMVSGEEIEYEVEPVEPVFEPPVRDSSIYQYDPEIGF